MLGSILHQFVSMSLDLVNSYSSIYGTCLEQAFFCGSDVILTGSPQVSSSQSGCQGCAASGQNRADTNSGWTEVIGTLKLL